MTGVSIRDYARYRKAAGLSGGTHKAVQKAIEARRISTLPDGSIDPAQADRDWAKNTRSSMTGWPQAPAAPPPPPAPGAPIDAGQRYMDARARKEEFAAQVAELDYKERAGQLVPRATVAEFASNVAAVVRDHIMAQADRLAPVLVGLEDEKAVHRMLSDDGAALLRKLSKALQNNGTPGSIRPE
jgi:hypothetical protein